MFRRRIHEKKHHGGHLIEPLPSPLIVSSSSPPGPKADDIATYVDAKLAAEAELAVDADLAAEAKKLAGLDIPVFLRSEMSMTTVKDDSGMPGAGFTQALSLRKPPQILASFSTPSTQKDGSSPQTLASHSTFQQFPVTGESAPSQPSYLVTGDSTSSHPSHLVSGDSASSHPSSEEQSN